MNTSRKFKLGVLRVNVDYIKRCAGLQSRVVAYRMTDYVVCYAWR